MVTNELMERFFSNNCTAEEQQLVMDYFTANPDAFAQYLDENEFNAFKNPADIDAALSNRLYEAVQRQTIKKARRIKLIRRVAAAAVVLGLLGATWIYVSDNKPVQPATAQVKETTNSLAAVTRHETNHTGKDKKLLLEDGSLIILSNNSEIIYQLPFTGARNIQVTGKAFFKVAKDRSRPFTVTSGPITTTALGTAFIVDAHKGFNEVAVRLYEGKVVIKAVSKSNKQLKKDVYLLPGQEFVYGAAAAPRMHHFTMKNTALPEQIMAQEMEADNPSVPQNSKGSWFQFNNRPVSEVLDQLAEIYKVKIVYNKKDVQNSYFIGKYNSTDSVEAILKRIGSLNQLTVTKNDDGFIISK